MHIVANTEVQMSIHIGRREKSLYTVLVGVGRATRLCAAGTRLLRLIYTQNGALRAPYAHRTFAALYSLSTALYIITSRRKISVWGN